jgi:hypothetical protein
MRTDVSRSSRTLAGIHAAYFLGTGIWAVLHRASFERVTGKKADYWLVRTVGGLAAALGLSLGLAVARGTRRPETVALAVASSAVFAAADLHAARAESRVYLGDVLVQLALAPAWLRPWRTPSA